MIELAFLAAFTLHNLEEALWLPAWSTRAGRFQKPVGAVPFRFAVSVVTALGYALTFLNFAFGAESAIARYAYLGFVCMMAMNAAFPHLFASIALRRYAPGLLTGLALNAPIGAYIVFAVYRPFVDPFAVIVSAVAVSAVVIASLKPLFAAGAALGAASGVSAKAVKHETIE